VSDTPKTDELAKREFVTDGVWIRHARELERENAELREDKERLDWLDAQRPSGTLPHEGSWTVIGKGNLRTAIDAARKEVKP